MAKRKVVWTKTTASQRRSILEYWVNRNKSNTYSIKILRLSNDKTKVIAQSPKVFRQADFPDTHRLSGTTVKILKSYLKN